MKTGRIVMIVALAGLTGCPAPTQDYKTLVLEYISERAAGDFEYVGPVAWSGPDTLALSYRDTDEHRELTRRAEEYESAAGDILRRIDLEDPGPHLISRHVHKAIRLQYAGDSLKSVIETNEKLNDPVFPCFVIGHTFNIVRGGDTIFCHGTFVLNATMQKVLRADLCPE